MSAYTCPACGSGHTAPVTAGRIDKWRCHQCQHRFQYDIKPLGSNLWACAQFFLLFTVIAMTLGLLAGR